MPACGGSGPEKCLHAIEAGDHRHILTRRKTDVLDAQTARLMPAFVAVANAQGFRSRGDLEVSRRTYSAAVRRLPETLQRRPVDDDLWRAASPIGEVGRSRAHLVVCVARIIWRDQYELDDLAKRARSMKPGDALVEALIEQLTWTYFDPAYLRARRERPASVGPPRTSTALCERASHLLHLGQPRARAVNRRDWKRCGSYDGLFAEALHRLATRPVVPWHRERIAKDVPVRLGHRRAVEYALQVNDYLLGS